MFFKQVTNLTKTQSNLAILFSVFMYFLFLFPLLNPQNQLAGSDAENSFYPARYYLNQQLHEGRFPFWTERIFLGYPIFADSEKAFLNPVNIAFTYVFGPFTSYKLMHLTFYLIGSLSLYKFLKNRGTNLKGYLAANAIYYFSFFNLYHIQHFSFMPAVYLLPTGVYIFDEYLNTHNFKYLVLHVLLTTLLIYFGSYQSVVLYLLASFGYLYFTLHKSASTKKQVLFALIYAVTVLFLSFPQLLPTAQLFLLSARSSGVNFTEGSFNPLMLVNNIYPFFFGEGAAYKWNQVSGQYFAHETYVYLGISTFILGVFSFISHKAGKYKNYLIFLITTYMFLGFIGFIPLVRNIPIPVISMFRYWGRSVVLLNFAVALLVATYLSSKATFSVKDLKTNSKYFFIFALYFLLMLLANIRHDTTTLTAQIFIRGAFKADSTLLVWASFLFTSLIIVLRLATNKIKQQKYLSSFLVLIVVLDLFVFGSRIAKNNIKDIREILPTLRISKLTSYENQRIVYFSPQNYWSRGLYYDSWSALGYSQYVPDTYLTVVNNFGFESLKILDEKQRSIIPKLGNLGVSRAFYYGQEIVITGGNDLVFGFDGGYDVIRKKEGDMLFRINSNKEQQITFKIRNYPGWKVYIDGDQVEILNNSDPIKKIFITTNISQGQHDVRLRFTPKSFYTGLLLLPFSVVGIMILKRNHLKLLK